MGGLDKTVNSGYPANMRFFRRLRRGEARDSAGGWFMNTPGRGKSPASLLFLSGGTSPVHLPGEGKRGKLRWRVEKPSPANLAPSTAY